MLSYCSVVVVNLGDLIMAFIFLSMKGHNRILSNKGFQLINIC